MRRFVQEPFGSPCRAGILLDRQASLPEVLQYVQGHFAGQAPYAVEADAMLQGMKESGTNLTAAALGRELTRA